MHFVIWCVVEFCMILKKIINCINQQKHPFSKNVFKFTSPIFIWKWKKKKMLSKAHPNVWSVIFFGQLYFWWDDLCVIYSWLNDLYFRSPSMKLTFFDQFGKKMVQTHFLFNVANIPSIWKTFLEKLSFSCVLVHVEICNMFFCSI